MDSVFGIYSLLPAVIALGLAIATKRVIESLLLGILMGVIMIDAHVNGIAHSLLYSLTNLFRAIVGYAPDPQKGLVGMGLIKNADRPEIVVVVMLLGSFITVMEKSGGAFAFGEKLTARIRTKKGVQTAAGVMGCVLFTSAYFSSLATGTVFKPIFDKLRISRAKLAFIIDATSAPVNTLIPISGWVAFMAQLMVDNIPAVEDGVFGLVKTIPFNFYCILLLVFVFLNARGVIREFGSMKKEEAKVQDPDRESEEELSVKERLREHRKLGTASDMIWPLGISVLILVVLGLWNYTIAGHGVPQIPLSGNQILILSFFIGIVIAYIKYVSSGLMTSKEFLDDALKGTKSAIIGGMIIVLAVTLGDVLRVATPEGVGAAQYLAAVSRDVIPSGIVPFAVFILASFMGFAMGTSWGVWGVMMPISIPLVLATGGNPFVTAAAVLSGGAFGDHCSPISDTTIISSIGAGCDHMTHVNTQLWYAVVVAIVASGCFLVAGFVF